MAYKCYSFVTNRETALLDEEEWREIRPLLVDWISSVKEYRAQTGASISEARTKHARAIEAERRYNELTGDTIEHPDLLWKLRMSQYGRLCPDCCKPFRRPQARSCAECGHQLPEGERAGPLTYPKEIT